MKTTKILGTVLAVFLALALFAGAGSAVAYIAPIDGSVDTTETIYLLDESGNVLNTIFAGRITADVVGTHEGTYKNAGEMASPGTGNTYLVFYPKTTLNVYLTGTGTSVADKNVLVGQVLDFAVVSNIVGQPAAVGSYGYRFSFTTPAGGTTNTFGTYTGATSTVTGITVVNPTGSETGTWRVVAEITSMSPYASNTYKKSNVISFNYGETVAASITASKDKIVVGESTLLTFKGTPAEVVTVAVTGGNGITVHPGQSGVTAAAGIVTTFTVTLNITGVRVVQIDTAGSDIKTYMFTGAFPVTATTETTKVTVEEGKVTLTAGKDAYYVGDEITLSGTSTGGNQVYLYIKGANKPIASLGSYPVPAPFFVPAGGYLNVLGGADSVTVKSDDTWEKKFTLPVGFDAGTYTIYASSTLISSNVPEFANDINAATLLLPLKEPYLTATAESSVVAKGNKLKLIGTAEATDYLMYYVFSTNYFSTGNFIVNDDGSYEVEIATAALDAGQYFVVVQHPMYDGVYNVAPFLDSAVGAGPANYAIVYNSQSAASVVTISPVIVAAPNAILYYTLERQSSNAAEALCAALDSQNIDDIYVKLTFVVTSPQLTVDPVSDVARGSPLTISGTSTFQAGTVVSVELVSAASSGTLITQNTVAVTESDGANIWNVTIDTSNIDEGLYIFRASAEGESASSLVLIFETPEETLSVPSVLTPGLTLKSLTVTPDYSPGVTEGTPVSVTAVLWLSRDVVSSQGLLKLTTDLSDTPVWNIDVYKGNVVNNQINGDILITTLNSTDFGTTISGFALDYDLPVTLVINLTGKVSSLDSNTAAVRIGGDLDGYGNAFTSSYLYGPKYVPVVSVDEVPLQSGWNFISVPKTLNTTIQSAKNLFVEVDTDNRSILGYDAFQKVWVSVESADPVQPLNAYWIYAKTPCSVDLAYPDTPALPAAKTLYPGWNAVGLSSLNNTPAQTALFGTSWRVLIPWNLEGGMFDLAIVNGGSDANSPSRLMTPGNGYWVYVDSESTLKGCTA